MVLHSIFLHLHSILRWFLLVFLVICIGNAVIKLASKHKDQQKDCVFNRIVMILAHLQLVFGLVLYFISPKVIFSAASMHSRVLRFFLVEHISMMIIAIALITIGYVRSQKATELVKKYRQILIFYSIALAIILYAIPWPWSGLGGGWY